MRLTTPMRDALKQARPPHGLRRVHVPGPGAPPWPAHPSTLAALLRHGLVEHDVDRDRRGYMRETWTTNDAGREALDPPPRHRSDRPRYLQRDVWRGGDYTTDPNRRIDELEVAIAPAHIVRAGRVRHADAQDRKSAANKLGRQKRAA